MYFWKIDDQTIRCLINREEIDQMGFDINTIGNDSVGMTEFLNAIVRNSKNYISWDSGNGIQNYVARALPSDQFLFAKGLAYFLKFLADGNMLRTYFFALTAFHTFIGRFPAMFAYQPFFLMKCLIFASV